jgi:hypothetical protein
VDATPRRAIELKNELGESLFSCQLDSNRAVEASFDRVGSSDWTRLCYRSTSADTIANLLQAYIVDVSVHHWDVRSPFDPGARLSPEGRSVMVRRYPHRPCWRDLPLPGSPPRLPVRFRFETPDGPTPGTDLVISAEGEHFMERAGFAPQPSCSSSPSSADREPLRGRPIDFARCLMSTLCSWTVAVRQIGTTRGGACRLRTGAPAPTDGPRRLAQQGGHTRPDGL